MTILIAPSSALCAECGCSAAGDPVRMTDEYDKVLEKRVPTYRHISTEYCLRAMARSERFWHGAQEGQAA